MFKRHCCILILASSLFVTQVPERIRAHLEATNDIHGIFRQTKELPDGRQFVSTGIFSVRPGRDFEWRTQSPFSTLFYADLNSYVYSNEDETVEKPLSELPYLPKISSDRQINLDDFFKAFNALYKEDEAGFFHILAKPKDKRLAKFLSQVEVDGVETNWTIKATFPDSTTLSVELQH